MLLPSTLMFGKEVVPTAVVTAELKATTAPDKDAGTEVVTPKMVMLVVNTISTAAIK